ncbi:hypothetical protein QR680_015498 [Steinernema hermaphroditum]|uniref:Nuclear receptor domain-containing protein n=1 Tax=Steinernema hermaphroditum TaxID=289476 RepID=A0AA39HA44_9BILA|nr:hypothetical protein QR680_015498 [Steinernema hermaphroditum]
MAETEAVCGICAKNVFVTRNFGAIACYACAAFFRRTIRSKLAYKCKNDAVCCSDTAVRDLTANAACKKCRLNRCHKEGMRDEFVQDPQQWEKVDETKGTTVEHSELIQRSVNPFVDHHQLPLLSATVRAIQRSIACKRVAPPGQLMGTSENGENCFRFDRAEHIGFDVVRGFRVILNNIPFLSNLNAETKRYIFDNTAQTFMAFSMAYQHGTLQQARTDRTRFFIMENTYWDTDPIKLLDLLQTKPLLRKSANMTRDLQFIAETLKKCSHYIMDELTPFVLDLFKSPEDLAAFIIILIIFKNDRKHPSYQQQISSLKSVFREIDLYHKMSGRDPASWANQVLFLSSLETTAQRFLLFSRMLSLCCTKNCLYVDLGSETEFFGGHSERLRMNYLP